MKFDKRDIVTIPNILTYFRIICVPVFIWLMLDRSVPNNIWWAIGVFMAATATDLVDGIIARSFRQITDLGKIIDPLADKLLQVSTLVCLTIIGHVHYAFTVILLLKETYMVLGASVLVLTVGKKVTIQSNYWGKITTFVNSAGIFLSFFHMPQYNNLYYIDWVFLGIGCALAIVSAIQYTVKVLAELKDNGSAVRETAKGPSPVIVDVKENDIESDDGDK